MSAQGRGGALPCIFGGGGNPGGGGMKLSQRVEAEKKAFEGILFILYVVYNLFIRYFMHSMKLSRRAEAEKGFDFFCFNIVYFFIIRYFMHFM